MIAEVILIVLASRSLLDTFQQFLRVVVAGHALDAGTILIHLLTELIF